jgi:DNA-binding CsgD family transcriptional regulator
MYRFESCQTLHPALKKHVLFTDYEHIKQICQKLKKIHINGFFYIRRFPDGSFIDLSTHLNWAEFFLTRYFEEKYEEKDLENHIFIDGDINLWKLNEGNIVWAEGAKHFGFGNGITIIHHEEGYDELFCFYSCVSQEKLNSFYLTHLDLLKKFCRYFIDKAGSIIQKGYSNLLHSPKRYLDLAEEKYRKAMATQALEVSDFLSSISSASGFRMNKLSDREQKCVGLCAKGYSAKEIAEKLFISRRTVETHIKNAKIKFNCRNTTELVYYFLKGHQCQFI